MAHNEPLGVTDSLAWRRDRRDAAEGPNPSTPATAAIGSAETARQRGSAAQPADAALEARRSMLMAGAALALYFGCVWLAADEFGVRLRYVAPAFAAVLAVDLALAASAPLWSSSPLVGIIYGGPQVLMLTVLLYLLGGLRASFLVPIYTVTIFRTAVLGTAAAVFATANVAGLSFGVLTLLEVNAWVPSQAGFALGWEPTAGQAAAIAFATWAVLNLVALYASRSGRHLRHFAEELQRKVAERTAELTAVNAELAAKAVALEEKQADLRSVVDAVTHELKNPMNAILLTADLLRDREHPALSEEGREDLERIVRLAGGTEDMIRDLLRLFEITSAFEAPVHTDLGVLVSQALETLQPQIGAKQAQVHVGALPAVWGQPRKLAHVLSNLLGNAVKYVPRGRGRIEVRADRRDGDVLLCVQDNGIGIPAAYHTRIFDLFRRVPADEQRVDGQEVTGTGVGLAVVKRIVEGHGGTVWVESEPGAGSRFCVRLPAAEERRRVRPR
jgi:signal transduction histidine kinase